MRKLGIVLVLLVTTLTFGSALWFKAANIESDVALRVADDLKTADASNINVIADGRQITLSGVVYDAQTEADYLKTAGQTYGALGPVDGLTLQADGGYLSATKTEIGISLRGTVPNETVRAAFIERAEAATDGTVEDALTISGPVADWQDEAAFGLDQLAAMTSGTFSAGTGAFSLSGALTDATDEASASLNAALAERANWTSYVASPQAPVDEAETIAVTEELERLSSDVADRDVVIADLAASMIEQTTQIDEKDLLLTEKDTVIEGLNGSIAALETDLKSLSATQLPADEQVVSLQSELDAANETLAQNVITIAELEQASASDASASDASGQVSALNATITQNAEAIDALSTQITQTTEEATRLQGELAERETSLSDASEELARLTAAAETSEVTKVALQGVASELTALVAERDTTIAALNAASSAHGSGDHSSDSAPMAMEQCAARANTALASAQINFNVGTATIQNGSVPLLERLTGIALACVTGGGLLVEIGGHTDSLGTDESNQALSEARAQAIKAFMVDRGAPDDGLQAVGYGEAQPIGDNETNEGRAANRRISFEWQMR